jgi:hypothetical protein
MKIAVDMLAQHATTDPPDQESTMLESVHAPLRRATEKGSDILFLLLSTGGLLQCLLPES